VTAGLEDLPHDVSAERKVLSAMLDSSIAVSPAIDVVAEKLTPDDFWRPGHQVAFRAMVVMRQCGHPVAVETVRDWIAREGDLAALGGAEAGVYLYGLWEQHVHWSAAGAFAEIVADQAARRRWIVAARRITQHARENPVIDDMHAAAVAEADSAAVHAGERTARSTRLIGAGAFAATAGVKPAPVIPGVINRMDRVIVAAGGGSGKTVLALQHLAAASVGIHPFGTDRYDPARVLWIDLELPDYLAAENLELVMQTARYYGNPDTDGRFQMLHRPRGLDLGDRGHRQLLAGLIRQHAPDFIAAGPVYKMHQDRGERGDHTQVMDFWDEMRDRYGFALWLETHPAKEGRFGGNAKRPSPAGSGRWSDWCEIGFGLVPGKSQHLWDVVPFRGQRDRSRAWPEQFQVNIAGGWPWLANYPQGTFGGLG
jgi:AAA domain/DnaB-like helicase N terminal domain